MIRIQRVVSALPLLLLFQCVNQNTYNPDSRLTAKERNAFIMHVIRYAAKGPENVSDAEKFDGEHDGYYQERASQSRLEAYYREGDRHHFLLSQPAPSLVEKRHATGGILTIDSAGKLTSYEEVFRTWKMVPDTLKERSFILFEKMVKGKSLEPFFTQNSKIEFIEFPDEHTFYNKSERRWQVKR